MDWFHVGTLCALADSLTADGPLQHVPGCCMSVELQPTLVIDGPAVPCSIYPIYPLGPELWGKARLCTRPSGEPGPPFLVYLDQGGGETVVAEAVSVDRLPGRLILRGPPLPDPQAVRHMWMCTLVRADSNAGP